MPLSAAVIGNCWLDHATKRYYSIGCNRDAENAGVENAWVDRRGIANLRPTNLENNANVLIIDVKNVQYKIKKYV